MKPATHDFDVITDTPAPHRRLPQRAEPAPQADAEEERRRAASRQAEPDTVRAAE